MIPFLKKAYTFVLIIFFLMLPTIPVLLMTKIGRTTDVSVLESRAMVALEPVQNPNLKRAVNYAKDGDLRAAFTIIYNLYTNATFVNNFEHALNDQFPFRLPIIEFSKGLDRRIIKFTYAFTKDIIFPADFTSNLYFDPEHEQLIHQPTLFNTKTKERINQRINNYSDLINAHPDQNFYLFYHQTLHNSEYYPIADLFYEADKGLGIQYFEQNIPKNLLLKKFLLGNFEDHLKYYYRTDHHWNVYGIIRAYEEIHEMLSKNFNQISPPLKINGIYEFDKIEFLGYMARRSLYPVTGDDFKVEIVDFPRHEIYINDQPFTEDLRNDYFSGNYSTIPYTNHFNGFYGNVANLIEYRFDNDTNRNLLIIGSSFRNALDPLLASHYDHTYCIDLRYYKNFSLSSFLEEHKVDDILVVGDNVVAFEDIEYWKINP